MKLKRIRKVEYDDKGEAIIEVMEHHLYDVHFIDNEDWLCIYEEDYTPEKLEARLKERAKFRIYKDDGNGIREYNFVYAPYIPIHFNDDVMNKVVAWNMYISPWTNK